MQIKAFYLKKFKHLLVVYSKIKAVELTFFSRFKELFRGKVMRLLYLCVIKQVND